MNIYIDIRDLFESIKSFQPYHITKIKFDKVFMKLQEQSKMFQTLNHTDNIEQLAGQLEIELASMDKSIQEASIKISEMLINSRTQDTGITLEVNERVLDSCTKLIQSILRLVKTSRLLQSEIVELGKGKF